MIVVIPVCNKDEQLVLKNLDWIADLDGKIDGDAVISCAEHFDVKSTLEKVRQVFRTPIDTITYPEWAGDPKWPHPQNWAWQSTARHFGNLKSQYGVSWLWWEADATPTAKGWCDAIKSEYESGNKPFMGCVMERVNGFDPHMNGVGIYPPEVAAYSIRAMLCRASPFDVVMWQDTQSRTHRANHIIQHHCRENGDSTHFPDQASVDAIVTPGVVLFHRCKDGSLIDRLRERKNSGGILSRIPQWVAPPKKKPVIPLIAHLDASSGYGIFSSQSAMELIKLGYDVEIFPASSNEIHGKLSPEIKKRIKNYPNPHNWALIIFPCVIQPGHLMLENKDYAMASMWESARLESPVEPKFTGAVGRFNKCKVVITPNSWNASCFNACGVDRPIRICPMGFDPDAFPLCANEVNGVMVFGTAAKTASGGVRKGFNAVVEAFRKAFPKQTDVALKIKAFPEDPAIETWGDARIKVLKKYISHAELVEWYRSLNVFVSGSAAEGWGRHQHEAMCMGRPIVSVDFGGVAEFFSNENGYAVDFTLVPAEGIYSGMGIYAKPSVDSMAEQMIRAYKNRKEFQEKSDMAAKSARRFTINSSTQTLIKILKEFNFPV